MPLFHARPRLRAAALLACCALLAALCATCAYKRAAPRSPAAQWSLGPEARASYAYLVYQDALRHGRIPDAEAALAELARLDPRPEMIIELAELRWRMGRTGEARETIKQGLEKFPADRALTMRLADTYAAEKRPDDAAAVLTEYLKVHPGDIETQHHLARVLIEQQRPDEALRLLSRLGEREVSAQTLFLQAKAHLARNDRRKAETLLKEALKRDPDFVPAMVELAFLYETGRQFAEAADIYERLLEMGENSQEVWLRLVGLSLRLNNVDKAMMLMQAGPQTSAFKLEAARIFLEEKRYDEAAVILAPLAAAPAPDPGVWFFQGVIAYEGRDNLDEALTYFARIPADSPLASRTQLLKAQLLLSKKRYDEALDEAAKGRKMAPGEPEFAELEAMTLHAKGDAPAALATLGEAMGKWPGNTRLEFRKAMVLYEVDDVDAALAMGETILAREPRNAEAQNFVGYVLADKSRDLDRALRLIRAALEQEPDNGYVIDSLAWAHFRRGEMPKAWADISRAVKLLPKDPAIWEHYGDIAKAMGKAAEARKGYEQALRNGHRKPEAVREKLKGL